VTFHTKGIIVQGAQSEFFVPLNVAEATRWNWSSSYKVDLIRFLPTTDIALYSQPFLAS